MIAPGSAGGRPHGGRVDSGGGAGIAADLHTFAAHGVWGTCAVTAVTAQNTVGVDAVEVLPAASWPPRSPPLPATSAWRATKTGMLGDAGIVEAVAAAVVSGTFTRWWSTRSPSRPPARR